MPDAVLIGFPDPREPQYGLAGGQIDGQHISKRYRRQAEILAYGRQLICEKPLAEFTVKELADRCALSTQSIHKRLGSKIDVLRTAIDDYTLALFRHAAKLAQGQQHIYWLACVFLQSCRQNPEFFSSTVVGAYHDRTGDELRHQSHLFGTRLIHHILVDLRQQGRVHPKADLHLAASTISVLLGHALLEWSLSRVDWHDLNYSLHQRIKLILLGMTSAECLDEIYDFYSTSRK